MKRAKRLETRTRSFERKIGTDHLDDVVRRRDLFDGFSWDCSHETLDFSLVCFEKRCQTYAVRSRFPNITKRVPIFVLVCCLGVETAQARDIIHKGDIIVVPLRGEISPSLLMFLRRTEKAAESSGASAIIFEMDTYGGRLDSAAEITNVLNRATIPTYTFINSNAGSAGSLIALATQHIYMAAVSAIGAAAPVLPTGEDLPLTEREKTISYWTALIRSSAIKNGHNPDVGEAFMNKDKEVKIGDRVIHPKGTVLTLSAQEAAEKINGKPLLADGIAVSIVDLTQKAGLKGNIVAFNPSGFEQLAFWITALAPLLLLGGILGAYLEFSDLFCALFPRPLSGGARGVGSGCTFRFGHGARLDRDPLFRAFHNRFRRAGHFSYGGVSALGNDRSLSRRNISSHRPNAGDAPAQAFPRDYRRRNRNRNSRALSAAHGVLSPVCSHHLKSSGSISRRRAA